MVEMSNIYYIALEFGLLQSNYIVLAQSKEDAIQTLSDYFDEVNVLYILSAQEVIDLWERVNENNNLFYLVLEVTQKDDMIFVTHNEQWNKTEEELLAQYAGKGVFLIDKKQLLNILETILSQLSNERNMPIVSENFEF